MLKPWKSFWVGPPSCCHCLCWWTYIPPGRRSCSCKLCWSAHENPEYRSGQPFQKFFLCFLISPDHISDIFWYLWVIFLIFSDLKSLYLQYFLISPDHISCWNLLLDHRAIHSHQPKLKAWQCKIEEKAPRKYNQGNVKSKTLKQEIFLSRETHGEALERSYQGRDREEGHWSFGQPRIRLW